MPLRSGKLLLAVGVQLSRVASRKLKKYSAGSEAKEIPLNYSTRLMAR